MDEQSIFLNSLEKATPEERISWLDEACGDDEVQKQRILQLIQKHEQALNFLEKPPAELEGTVITDSSGDEADSFSGRAEQSVLMSLSKSIKVPHISLRESVQGGDAPIERPNSKEIPQLSPESRYRLDGEIARGGMGAIIKGRDTDLGRDLAIKVLLDSHKDKPEVIERFIEEAQIGGQLQHPGIVPIYHLGQFADQRPFFAMKLVKGQTLSKLLKGRENIEAERGRFLGIFEQVCQTMAYAHSRGVIHRDLKPSNIMVGAFGEVQVMDWGLAKVLAAGGIEDEKQAHSKHKDISIIQTMRSAGSDTPGTFGTAGSQTQMGSVMGTPAYMPPEQALGEIDNLNERADVFGLGAILCEILTGKPPYVADDGTQVFRMASRGKLDECLERLDDCGADVELIQLTKECLAPELTDRPRDAGVLAERVSGYLESVETKLRETETRRAAESARAFEAKKRMKVTMALAASILLFIGIGGTAWRQMELKENERREVAIGRFNSAMSDASLHQSLAETGDLNTQLVELDKAISSADQAVELAEQDRIGKDFDNRALQLRSDLESTAANVRQLAVQKRKDHEFREELELIRLSQSDRRTFEVLLDDLDDIRRFSVDEENGNPSDFQAEGGIRQSRIFELFDIDSAPDRYEEAFRKAGIDLITLDVSRAVEKIRSSEIRESQIAAIDNWARAIHPPESLSEIVPNDIDTKDAGEKKEDYEKSESLALRRKLLAIANTADNNDERRRLRDALEANDTLELKKLAANQDTLSQSPELMAWLGAVLRDGNEIEASVAVLSKAQHLHPGDFWLNYELGKSLVEQNRHLEGLGYIRTALGIRPESLGAMMALASSSMKANRYEEAAAIYRLVAEKDPTLLEAHTGLASAAWYLRQWNVAIAEYRAALLLDPENVELRGSLGIVLALAGHIKEGVAECQKAVELEPQNATTHQNLAQALHGATIEGISQSEAAKQAYLNAIALDPQNAKTYYNLALLEFQYLHNRRDSSSHLRTSIELDPTSTPAYILLSHMSGGSPTAVAVAERAVELEPQNSETHRFLAMKLHKAKRLEESLVAARAAVSLNPEDGYAHCTLGESLDSLRRHEEAIIEFRKASELIPRSAWIQYRLGVALIDRGYADEGLLTLARTPLYEYAENWFIESLKKALQTAFVELVRKNRVDVIEPGIVSMFKTNPNSNLIVEFLSDALQASELYDELSAYRKLTELAPQNVFVWRHLSRELQRQKSFDEAITACQTAIQLAPHSREPYGQLASIYASKGITDVFETYRKVLETYPNSSAALNGFALAMITAPGANGDYTHGPEVVQWAKDACELEPTNGSNWNTLGAAFYRRGEWEAAVETLQKAQSLQVGDVSFNRLFLTMSNWQLGKRQEAIEAYVEAFPWRQQQRLQNLFDEVKSLVGRDGLTLALEAMPENADLANELAEMVLDANDGEWTVLQPIEMTSKAGATLTLLDDDSILVSGTNSIGDQYDFTFILSKETELSAMRLETLTDPSLPENGPGRSASGDFVLRSWDLKAISNEDDEPESLKFDAAIADFDYEDSPIKPDGWWSIIGSPSENYVAYWRTTDSRRLPAGTRLHLQLRHFVRDELSNLGRFRLSISGVPLAFECEQVRLKSGSPWAKLAGAYQMDGDQTQLQKLLADNPQAAESIADLHMLNHRWQEAVDVYSTLISPDSPDPRLLMKRGNAFFESGQWEAAKTDWLASIEESPDIAAYAFWKFTNVGQLQEAAAFGLPMLKQNSDRSFVWAQVASVIARSSKSEDYAEFCEWVAQQPTATPADMENSIRACLLRPGAINVSQLPSEQLLEALEDGINYPGFFRKRGWSTMALLAYRKDKPELAMNYLQKSENQQNNPYTHAMNLALNVLVRDQLESDPAEARQNLVEARKALEEAKADFKKKVPSNYTKILQNHLEHAEILFAEARQLLEVDTPRDEPKTVPEADAGKE